LEELTFPCELKVATGRLVYQHVQEGIGQVDAGEEVALIDQHAC
jgi:hypothetical protein